MADTCGSCRYFHPADGGLCRRFPPMPFVQTGPGDAGVPRQQLVAFFPPMNPDKGWCGEYGPPLNS